MENIRGVAICRFVKDGYLPKLLVKFRYLFSNSSHPANASNAGWLDHQLFYFKAGMAFLSVSTNGQGTLGMSYRRNGSCPGQPIIMGKKTHRKLST